MHRPVAQIAALDQAAHASRDVAELIVMSRGDFESFLIGEFNQFPGFVLVDREWLFHIDVAAPVQAEFRDTKVAFRRRGNVDHVGLGFTQKLRQVGKTFFDREPLVELPRHERLPVADPDDLTALDSLKRQGMRIRDLAATNDSDLKHRDLHVRHASKYRFNPSAMLTLGAQFNRSFSFSLLYVVFFQKECHPPRLNAGGSWP